MFLEGQFLRFPLGEMSWNPPSSGKSVPGPRLQVSLKRPLWDARGGGVVTNKSTSSPKWSGYTTDSSIYVTRPLTSAAVAAAGAKAAMML